MSRQNYFVVVPVYNEQERVGIFLKKLKKITKRILVVDDGSEDRSAEIVNRLKIPIISHSINLGKGAAMKTGAEVAWKLGTKRIVFMDGDDQHDPKILPAILKKLDSGYDLVFAARTISTKTPLARYLGNRIGVYLINLFLGINRSDPFCGCFGMTKRAYDRIVWDSSNYNVETEITAKTIKNKLKYSEVPISAIYHDKYKGITILDALKIMINIPKYRFQ